MDLRHERGLLRAAHFQQLEEVQAARRANGLRHLANIHCGNAVGDEGGQLAGRAPAEHSALERRAGIGVGDRQLREVMFYGKWFGWVSRILAAALRFFHDLTGNWGVAIILLTIAVRSLLWPLQARSNAQMKKMGKLSPMLKELQAKWDEWNATLVPPLWGATGGDGDGEEPAAPRKRRKQAAAGTE